MYGIHELVNAIEHDPGPPTRVKCYVGGCEHWVRPPAKGFKGEPCPIHNVICHHSSGGVTLTCQDPRDNLFEGNLFLRKVRHNPHKVESFRFGWLNSEDAVTWNVFRTLQNAGLLHLITQAVTGKPTSEPLLYLWGLSSWDHKFQPWPLLTQARLRWEVGRLPVDRPPSEPDLALHIPGELLVLIEAKLLSDNPVVYPGRPRATPQSLTFEEVTFHYDGPELTLHDRERVQASEKVYSQLLRYLTFVDYMSSCDGTGTKAYLVNLVRHGQEHDAAHCLFEILKPEYKARFVRITWSHIYHLLLPHRDRVIDLLEYFVSKPIGTRHGFVPAFQTDVW